MKTLIVGLSGRMGQEICQLIEETPGLNLVGGIARQPVESFPCFSSLSDVNVDVEMVIDFSLPVLSRDVFDFCRQRKCALVSGVTGLSEEQERSLKSLSTEVATLWSANMSLGVTWLKSVLRATNAIDSFDFQIEEIHHRNKKDSPSGTAKMLQSELESSLKRSLPEPVSIRGGGVFGVHRIFCLGQEESITLEHVAGSRTVFARGAIRAALWLKGQKPGFYSLEDVLGL